MYDTTQSLKVTSMKYAPLIAYVFLSTANICHAMIKVVEEQEGRRNRHFALHFELRPSNRERHLPSETLLRGVEWDQQNLIEHGIQMGGNITYGDPNCIQIACNKKNYPIIKLLLSVANSNSKAVGKTTMDAFQIAIAQNDETLLNLLTNHLEKNHQSINLARDDIGNTPLHIACLTNNAQIIQFLLNKGNRTTTRNNNKKTPIAVAFFENQNFDTFYATDHKSLLLKKNKDGNTQLHLSTFIIGVDNQQFDQYITFLLAHGCSLSIRNKKHKLALDLARQEYVKFYKQYIHSQEHSDDLYNSLIQKEMVLHSFLRFHSSQTQYALFIHLFNKYIQDGLQCIPKELQQYIAILYYALNIEIIIANKYKYCTQYYRRYPQEKNRIKKKLFKNPEPSLLFRSII